MLDELVYGGPRLYEHHHLPRLLERADEFFERVRTEELLALAAPVHEVVHLGGGAVEYRDGKAFAFDVEGDVLAHYGEPDEADVRLWCGHSKFLSKSLSFGYIVRRRKAASTRISAPGNT